MLRLPLVLVPLILLFGLSIPRQQCGVMAAGVGADDAAGAGGSNDSQATTYLYPILRWGPNNQKRDLRHVLALAKELQAGVVLTGVFKHYLDGSGTTGGGAAARSNRANSTTKGVSTGGSPRRLVLGKDGAEEEEKKAEARGRGSMKPGRSLAPRPGTQGGRAANPAPGSCFSEPVPQYMPFEEILDREPVDAWVPTKTVAELRADGWSGTFDALVATSNTSLFLPWSASKYVDRALEVEGLSIPESAERIHVSDPLRCDADRIAELRDKLKPHRVVVLQVILLGYSDTYDLREEARGPNTTDASKAGCHASLHEANHLLRPAPWIRDLASRYVQQVMHFGQEPYMAAHIRPYPDECLSKWKYGRFEPLRLAALCIPEHVDLHLRLAGCVSKVMDMTGVRRLFVMSHPALYVPVNTMLSLGGVTNAMYLSAHQLTRLAGCPDTTATFLSMVEEEISVQAHGFLGTALSSITQNIAYQRLGATRGRNYYFESLEC